MCNLIWCYLGMLVCFAWIVAQLLDQRPSFLAVVRHISVLNKSLPRFPPFHCQRLCEFVSCRGSGCGGGVLFVQLDVFIVLLCQVCSESRDIILSASPWNVLSGLLATDCIQPPPMFAVTTHITTPFSRISSIRRTTAMFGIIA